METSDESHIQVAYWESVLFYAALALVAALWIFVLVMVLGAALEWEAVIIGPRFS